MRYRFLRFPNGKPKAVTFSYDDGTRTDLKLVKILDAYKIKCTFNIPTASTGENYLTEEEIKSILYDKGHEIAVHCANHRAPGQERAIEGIQDVLENRLELERILGSIVRGMAYPNCGIRKMENGASYDNIRRYLNDLGIVYSRTLGNDNDSFMLPTDWYAWMPTAHHENPQIFEYIEKFLNFNPETAYISQKSPMLFYLWGHSYEYENNKNWDRLENICDKLGNNEDVWYATNIEIYNYVNAYSSLIFSADGTKIYNPTLLTVWFETDDKLYSVKSGETIVLN